MPPVAPEAVEAGMRALSRRELSRTELVARLERSGFSPEDAARAAEHLARAGYQSDERMASERARALAVRAYGDLAIRHDLKRRGVGDDDVAVALAHVDPESTRAESLARRTGGGSAYMRALHRKGFTEGSIERAAAAALRTTGDPG